MAIIDIPVRTSAIGARSSVVTGSFTRLNDGGASLEVNVVDHEGQADKVRFLFISTLGEVETLESQHETLIELAAVIGEAATEIEQSLSEARRNRAQDRAGVEASQEGRLT